MIKFLPKNSALLLPLLLPFILAQACTQMDKTLGENFIPDSQQLKVALFDASSFCSFKTVRADSISTAGFGYGVLGVVNDDRLGKTSAGFAATFLPIEYGYAFDGAAKLDSAFLMLDFSSIAPYGSGKDPMSFLVYEMKSNIGSVVYGAAPGLIDTMIFQTPVNVGGTSAVGYDSLSARIRLSDELLPKLLKVENADTFAASFKGLYVTVDTAGVANGCIKYADIVATASYMPASAIVAYYPYHDTINDTIVARAYYYYVYHDSYLSTPRFNAYLHDYKALTQTNEVLYMQGLCGVATQLTFNLDSISAWVNQRHIAVNRAELILPVEDSERPQVVDEQYSTAMSCIAKTKTSDTTSAYSPILDMYSSTFGGGINRSLMEYSINITHAFNAALPKYIKNELVEGVSNPMLIIPNEYTNNARSIFIRNRAGRNSKPLLKIWYGEIR